MKDTYLERNYIENQFDKVDGICIDPEMRWGFNSTDHNERERKEIDDWWDVLFITTQGWSRDTYLEYTNRMNGHDIEDEEDWNQSRAEQMKQWFEHYPDGFRYDVRCLDGNAWDRSTNCGHFDNLQSALNFIQDMK